MTFQEDNKKLEEEEVLFEKLLRQAIEENGVEMKDRLTKLQNEHMARIKDILSKKDT